MSGLKAFFEARQQSMIELLTATVERESPTHEKAAVDALSQYLKDQLEAIGAEVDVHPREHVGDLLLATWNGDAEGKPILIVSHMDTVHPLGSVAERPVRLEDDGRLYGPGALDMKGGIVVAIDALAGLRERNELPARPIQFLITTDEEKGSRYSRELIEELAADAALVMVTEPPTRDGSLKTWRKGVSSYRLTIQGRAAHAGNEPEEGVNAIIEFAQHALELNKLNDLPNGTSVSVTVVNGGTTTNVIPAQVNAAIDVRVMSQPVYEKLHAEIMDRMPFIPGADVTIERLHYRPPMERDGDAFGKAKQIATQEDITIREAGAGGGSDGNFTAAMGIPTLDGLGVEGSGLHADHEHILISSLPKKAALMAAIIRDWD